MKLKKDYILPEAFANLLQYGLPLAYVLSVYNVFGNEETVRQITGGTILFVGIVWFFFRSRIKKFVNDYNTHLGEVAQKAKWGIIFSGLVIVLALAQFWIQGAMMFFATLGASNLVSLPFYTIARNRETKYKELKKYIKNKELDNLYQSAT
jgi:hypothetical protein